ncbi:tyrosine-type recombinase/integrase [Methanobacterium sp.]|uniref:tyrosine-type recombinase/integrase n=1 Tax=Methanobacterium sp. TaxID=2164 RepID=UPI003C72DA24
MNIQNDPHLIEFLQNLNVRKTTQEIYIKRLKVYCQFTGKTPTQLIEEAEEDEENRIRMKNRRIKKDIMKYLVYLREQNRSPNYITNLIATVKSFYGEYEIELPRIRCNIKQEEELITTEDIINKKHIQKVLKYCNTKFKAIILLMMSSGMGSSEIRHLTFNNFITSQGITIKEPFDIDELLEILEKKRNEIGTWSIRRFKTNMPYVTFNSPESTAAIIDYLHYRTEHINPAKHVKNVDDFLFEARGKQMSLRGIMAYFERLNDKCKFGYLGRQRFFRSHGIRKFFASTLKNHGMDTIDAEWLIGHKLPMVTGTYIKPDIYRLKKEYMDILPHLSLSDVKTVTIESEEVKQLKESFEEKLSERDEQTKPLLWLAEVLNADPELAEQFKKSALKHNIK